MNFTRAEARQRTRYLESAHAELVTGLNEPAVQVALGQTALDLLEIAEELYIPNVQNGIISVPLRFRNPSNATPVIIAKPGENFLLDRSMAPMNNLQRPQYMQVLGESLGDDFRKDCLKHETDMINGRLKKATPFGPIDVGEYLGLVTAVSTKTDKYKLKGSPEPRQVLAFGRPLVMLAYQPPNLPSSIFLHELNHVKQFIDRPIWLSDQPDYADELERLERGSYGLAAKYAEALGEPESGKYPGMASDFGMRLFERDKRVSQSLVAISGLEPDRAIMAMREFMPKIGYTPFKKSPPN